jgi:hypothetical protein
MDMNVFEKMSGSRYTNVLGAIEREMWRAHGRPKLQQICFSVPILEYVHIPLLDCPSIVESVEVTVSNVIMSKEFGGAWAFRSNDSHPATKHFSERAGSCKQAIRGKEESGPIQPIAIGIALWKRLVFNTTHPLLGHRLVCCSSLLKLFVW